MSTGAATHAAHVAASRRIDGGGGGCGSSTLDMEHMSMVGKIRSSRAVADRIRGEIRALRHRVVEIQQQDSSSMEDCEFDELKHATHRIHQLSEKLHEADNNGDMVNYLMSTGNILFRYYDIIDKGVQRNDTTVKQRTQASVSPNSVLSYFCKGTAAAASDKIATQQQQQQQQQLYFLSRGF